MSTVTHLEATNNETAHLNGGQSQCTSEAGAVANPAQTNENQGDNDMGNDNGYIIIYISNKNYGNNWDGGYLYYPFLHSTVYILFL